MREVAVTDGDKVEAQRRLGFSINTWGVGDLVKVVNEASDADVDALVAQYLDEYDVAAELRPGGDRAQSLRDGARIELGLRRFLADGGFTAFTDTFEDLHGLKQLPGLAVQRLMADGYGFGGEGDWKTSAMVRAMKVMSAGLPGGTSFMEDYTYHLTGDDDLILGAHMLEVCPSIAGDRPRLEVHPLSIGGKEDPVRLVFDAHPGPAVAACITDMGQRFRMVATVVDVVPAEQPLPKLPVARAVWRAQIAAALDDAPAIPVRVVTKPVLTGSDGILALVREANADPACVGLITWMHTFCPAKMWIAGLEALDKPFLHLHTQFNRDIPWADIDMDFMNLNQAAHGDREFGFIAARLRLERKVVVGHWGDAAVQEEIGDLDARGVRLGRLAGREDRALRRQHARGRRHRGRQGRGPEPARLLHQHAGAWATSSRSSTTPPTRTWTPWWPQYLDEYDVAAELRPGGDRAQSLRDGARIELGLRRFLVEAASSRSPTPSRTCTASSSSPGSPSSA